MTRSARRIATGVVASWLVCSAAAYAQNGEPQAPTIAFSHEFTSRGEDDPGDHLIAVSRFGDTSSAASVEIVASGTATVEEDYRLTPTVLDFAGGEDLKWVTITVLDDARREGLELAEFTLTNPTNGHQIGVRRRWTHLIADNELAPPTAYATTDTNRLVAFTIGDGAFTSDVPITGLAPGETIVALDIGGRDAELFDEPAVSHHAGRGRSDRRGDWQRAVHAGADWCPLRDGSRCALLPASRHRQCSTARCGAIRSSRSKIGGGSRPTCAAWV